MKTLDRRQLEHFITAGFVKLPHAFPRDLAEECRQLLWLELGRDPSDRSTWTEPVAYVWDCTAEPFQRAANTPALQGAFDQLVGRGRWVPRTSLGWFCIRFPSSQEPADAGWHVDGSYPTEDPDVYGLNVRSRNRALLMLFLFSDIGMRDAPTRLRVGSHLDVPRLLEPAGPIGMTDRELFGQLGVTSHRPVAYATGLAGDVYLCHPFLVHAAQAHRGATPRFLAQPSLRLLGELELDAPDTDRSPVETAVRLGLGR